MSSSTPPSHVLAVLAVYSTLFSASPILSLLACFCPVPDEKCPSWLCWTCPCFLTLLALHFLARDWVVELKVCSAAVVEVSVAGVLCHIWVVECCSSIAGVGITLLINTVSSRWSWPIWLMEACSSVAAEALSG